MTSSHQALYRVWRPQRLSDVAGQSHITGTLRNAFKNNKIVHAYLFSGPRGTGKTSVARIFAKAINCLDPIGVEPCNKCEICLGINSGSIMDVIEMDAASNRGVDEIRDIRDRVKYAPTNIKYKVYIIDEAHMLTPEAFNALLKVLEEPPKHIVFILATTEVHKIPLTISSRCQSYSFGHVALQEIIDRLHIIIEDMDIKVPDGALYAIAKASDGGMRDAIGMLDQLITLGESEISDGDIAAITGTLSKAMIEEFAYTIQDKNISQMANLLNKYRVSGLEPKVLIQELTLYFRDKLFEQVSAEYTDKCIYIIDKLVEYGQKMRNNLHSAILLEIALISLCTDNNLDNNLNEIRVLQNRVSDLERIINSNPDPVSGVEVEAKDTISADKIKFISTSPSTFFPDMLGDIKQKWPDILNCVKREKITVHAWLVAGVPVAVTSDCLYVAYHSKIHCDTIMKEANKNLVEQVLISKLGNITSFRALMWNDWQELNPMLEDSTQVKINKIDIAKTAIDLFGESLVELKNTNNILGDNK